MSDTTATAPAEPGLNYTCTCDPCRDGYPDHCEVAYYNAVAEEEENRLQYQYGDLDFGMRTTAGNKALRDILARLVDNIEERLCPCVVLEALDGFDYSAADGELPEGTEPANPEEVREYFLKHYKDYAELEECEGDECGYPNGIDCTPDPTDYLFEQACADVDWAAWNRGLEASSKRYL
jgi:hypothetical protein